MRPSRILLAPDFSESGGVPDADVLVTISRAELDELRALAAAGVAPSPTGIDAPAEPSGAALAREAAFLGEIAAKDRKAAELDRAYKEALLDRELATALVGKPLVPGAASQLIRLWRDEFEAIDEGGSIRVLARDGRAVEQAVADRLAGPDFAHFCLPSSRGGTGTKGQNRSAVTSPTPAAPRTLGEAVLMRWREAAARSPGPTPNPGWGRHR